MVFFAQKRWIAQMTGMIRGLARWLRYALRSVYLAHKNRVGDKGTRTFSFSFFKGPRDIFLTNLCHFSHFSSFQFIHIAITQL